MAIGMKRLAKETAVYGLSSIIGRFLNWMLVPMYVRVLSSPEDYGVVTNLYGWTALLLVMLLYGMETGFFRFINKPEEKNPIRVYATALRSVGWTSALFFGMLLINLPRVASALGYESHPEYITMMAGITAMDAFCSISFAYLRYKRKAYRFAGIRLFSIALNIVLNIFFLVGCPWLMTYAPSSIDWFYKPGYGVGYIFFTNVITTLVTFLMLFPDIWVGLKEKADFQLLGRMLNYSFPILLLGIAGIFNQTADKILFPFLFEDKAYAIEQLGIYGACFKISVVMVMFIQAFRYAYEPFIFAKNKSEDDKLAYAEAMRYFILFALVIFLGVMYYLDLLKFFVAESYYPGLRVVPIVMLGSFFFGVYFNLSLWYKLLDETKWGAYFSFMGCAVTVAIIVVFTPKYGYMACAWASFICNLLMMVVSYFVGQKKYFIDYNLKSAGIFFTLAMLFYAVGTLVKIPNLWLRLTYRTILLGVYVALILWKEVPLTQLFPQLKNK